ncbi:hypothetical protein CAPN004_03970 [Capnocytophaga cynodegmi]|uniref:hypothetical protein n=1 Tax=Capnocytophaga cynodegmi TaxID=28189 RepID=UPI001ACB354F|nr:hypothetical protein [Capnocytophaga cynodegmi]GIM51367.1 hypothetical protein CAPN004_03970 [Capnocytophaga cynodegmi]
MEELHIRFENFLNKLTERANELAKETKSSVQDFYNDDIDPHKRSFFNFKMGIQGQFTSIINKAQEVFDNQIQFHEPTIREKQTPEGNIKEKWFRKIHDEFENWKDQIRNLSDDTFKDVKEKSPEITLQEIIDEYNQIKDNFHCTQCGGKLDINEIYFIATYVPCPYCQTQNTFVPSTKMRELEFIAKDLAEERTKKEEKRYEKIANKNTSTPEEIFAAYFRWRLAVWKEVKNIVPVLEQANKKVFFREVHDLMTYDGYNFYENPDLYRNIIQLLTQTEPENQKIVIELFEYIGERGIPQQEFKNLISNIEIDS